MTTLTATDWPCWRDPRHTVEPHSTWKWPQCVDCGAAPPYHERTAYIPDSLALLLVVPAATAQLGIAPRAGIVATLTPDDADTQSTLVAYEGWVNGPMQYAGRDARGLWEAGVMHAAGRLITAYPSVALARVGTRHLRVIGLYYPKADKFVVEDEESLDGWLSS